MRPIPFFLILIMLLTLTIPLSAMPPLHPEQTFMVDLGSPDRPYGLAFYPSDGPNRIPTAGTGIGNSLVPVTGTAKVLIIPVYFSDQAMDFAAVNEWSTHLSNFAQFYYALSRYKLTIEPTLASSNYLMPKTMAYYGADSSTTQDELITDAVNAADGDVDFSLYNSIIVVHAGAGEESNNTGNSDLIQSVYFWQEATPIVTVTEASGQVDVWGAIILPESEENASVFGTLCHEFGHQITADDFYDPRGTYVGSCGEWALMAYGGWGYTSDPASLPGTAPAPMMAWNVVRMGWQDPEIVTSNQGPSAPLVITGYDALRFYKLWKEGNGASEYFLLEFRAQVPNFSFTPLYNRNTESMQEGVLIWRIRNSIVDNHRDYADGMLVELMQADGLGHLNQLLSGPAWGRSTGNVNRGDPGDIFPGDLTNRDFHASTSPSSNASDGSPTWVGVRDVQITGSGTGISLSMQLYVKPVLTIFEGDGQSGTVDQVFPTELQVLCADSAGTPISGVPVDFAVIAGSGTLGTNSAASGADGLARTTFTPNSLGTIQISATSSVGQPLTGSSLTFNVTGTSGGGSTINAGNSIVSIYPTTLAANGVATAEVLIMAMDDSNNPVADATVTLNVSGSGNTVIPPSIVTNAEGQAIFALSSNEAGTKTIIATAGGVVLSTQPAVTFTTGGPTVSATLSTATAEPASVPADGSTQSTITATIKDGNGSVLSGVSVTIQPDGGPVYGPIVTNGSGVATVSFTSAIAGAVAHTVIADGITLDTRPTITYTVVGEPVSASTSTVTVTPANLPADGTTTATITVTVRDGSSNPLIERPVSLSVTGTGNQITPTSINSSADGTAVFTISSTVVEIKTITATADGVTISSQPTVTFESTGVDISASLSTVAVSPASLPADGTTPSTVTVMVKSSGGTAVSGVTVALEATGSNSISPTTVASGADGSAVFSLISTETGIKTLTASAGGVTLDQKPQVTFITVQRVVSATLSTVTATPDTALADGSATITINALIKDTTGTAYSGVTVNASVSGGGTTLTPASATSSTDGSVSFTLKATSAGTKEIILTADSVSLQTRPVVTFTAPPRNVDKDLSTVSVTPTTVYADGIQAAAIHAVILDQNGEPYSGITVQLIISGSDNTIAPASMVSGADGAVDFTLSSTRVEKKQITVNAGGLILTSRPYVDFVLQGVSAVKSTVTASPASGIIANGAAESRITIRLKNMDDQVIPGVVPVITVSGSNFTLLPSPIPATDADGMCQLTLKTTQAGARQINVQASGVQLQDHPTISFIAGTATKISRVQATEGQSGVVGTTLNSPLKVMVQDVNNNVVSGYSVSFSVTEVPANATGQTWTTPVITDTNGIAATSVTLGSRTGTYKFQAVATGLDGTPISFSATAVAGSATTLSKDATTDLQTGPVYSSMPIPLRVQILDSLGNPRSGVNVNWSISGIPPGASGGLVTPGTAVSDSDGYARTSLTLGSLVGNWTVQAAATGLAGSPATFTATAVAGAAYRMELLSGNNQTATVGSGLPLPLVIKVTDSGVNPVTGHPVTFQVSGGDASFTQSMPILTGSDGQASANLQLGDAAGTIYLTIRSSVSIGGVLSAQATASPGAASTISANPGLPLTAVVKNYLSMPLSVRVTDSKGNGISGYSVGFAFSTVPSGSAGQLIETTSATTDSSGQASTRVLLGDKTGIYAVQASAPGLTGHPISFNLTALSGTADGSNSDFTITAPSPLVANGSDFATVEVTVKDQWGNLVSGLDPQRIRISSSNSSDQITQPVDATDSSGRTWGWIRATRSGSRQIGAVVEGITLTRVTSLLFSPGAPDKDASSSVANPQGNIEIINGSALITITLLDRFYNPVPDFDATRVTVAVTGTGNTLQTPAGTSTADGKVYASLSSTEAGFKVVTISVDGTALTQSLTLLFVTRAVDTTRSTFNWVSGSDVPANGSSYYVMRLQVRDVDGQAVSGVPVSAVEVHPVDSGATLSGSAQSVTDANGEALIRVRATTAGTLTCHAWVSGLKIEQAAVLKFVSGSASKLAAGGPITATAMAGGSPTESFLAKVTDAFGNPVANVNVTFAITGRPAGSTGGSVNPASASTGTDGNARSLFTAGNLAGTWTITASVAGLSGSPVTFTCTVRAAGLADFRITLDTAGAFSGRTYDGVTVQALDSYGNAKTDYLGSVWFTSSDSLAILPWSNTRRYAFTTADAGSHTFDSFVFLTTGSVTLTVTDGTVSRAASPITVIAPAGSTTAFQLAAFAMPGDGDSVFVAIKPTAALEYTPTIRLKTLDGTVLDLVANAREDGRWYATGRTGGHPVSGGSIHVIGRRSGTLDYVTAETVVE